MKVGELIQSDKEEWSRLYHGYAEFYEMEMNQDILDTVWSGYLILIINFLQLVLGRTRMS